LKEEVMTYLRSEIALRQRLLSTPQDNTGTQFKQGVDRDVVKTQIEYLEHALECVRIVAR